MKLAVVTPWPNYVNGVAESAYEFVKELAKHCHVVVFSTVECIPAPIENVTVKFMSNCDIRELRNFESIIYHVGNNPVHESMIHLIKAFPGVIHVHDAYLGHLFAKAYYLDRGEASFFTLVESCYGVEKRKWIENKIKYSNEKFWEESWFINEFDFLAPFIKHATGAIVHSEYAKSLVRKFDSELPILKTYQFYDLSPGNSSRVNKKVGIFGYITKNKLVDQKLMALKELAAHGRDFEVVIVGSVAEDYPAFYEQLKQLRKYVPVKLEEGLSNTKFTHELASCDLVLSLREPSYGETSAVVMKALCAAVPVIVSDVGWYSELPSFIPKINSHKNKSLSGDLYKELYRLFYIPGALEKLKKDISSFVAVNVSPVNCSKAILDLSKKCVSKHKPKKRIAFLVQRFGDSVNGGAEYIAKLYAKKLSSYFDIDILTSTSQGLDWDNKLPEIDSLDNYTNVLVRRFKTEPVNSVTLSRDTSSFFRLSSKYSLQGPNSNEMDSYISSFNQNYDFVVAWTYLFKTTFNAIRFTNVKKAVVPFFHDEPNAYFDGFNEVFQNFDHIIFQTPEEVSYVKKILGADCINEFSVIGSGLEQDYDDEAVTDISKSIEDEYILYIGRIEPGKNVSELFDSFILYKLRNPESNLKLKVIGKIDGVEFPETQFIEHLGFVSEEEKLSYISKAKALINPSKYESLSMVLLESWSMKTPVIVNGYCKVMAGQCERSNGGFYYNNYYELEKLLSWISKEENSELLTAIGQQGFDYYSSTYNWDIVERKFLKVLGDYI
ncbi:glycosyltransferase [Thalassotalea montiporae]